MTEEEAAAAPEGTKTLPLTGMPQYKFVMTISSLDCTGCGSCANVCPGKKGEKALTMVSLDKNLEAQKGYDYGQTLPIKQDVIDKYKETTVKGSQFKQPLLEFSGAVSYTHLWLPQRRQLYHDPSAHRRSDRIGAPALSLRWA